MRVWVAHEAALELLPPFLDGAADLDAAVQLEVYRGAGTPLPSDPAGVRIWVPPFMPGKAVALAAEMPALELIQLLSAGIDPWVGRVPDGVTLCDARGVHSAPVAEWAVAAILGYLRDLPRFARAQAAGEWVSPPGNVTDTLTGKRVLIVGAGAIGEAICARLAPFEAELTRVARRPRPADGVYGIDQLPDLLPAADIVVLAVPLTAQTRGMVDAAFLTRMPDGALLVNAARGSVVQTGALLAELTSGRLHAALDVTDPEPLPPDHPLWTVDNLLLTPHVASAVRNLLVHAYGLVGEQLRRVLAGQPLANVVTGDY